MHVTCRRCNGLGQPTYDAIDYTEGVEIKWKALYSSVLNLTVPIVEIREECWTVMTSVGLCE